MFQAPDRWYSKSIDLAVHDDFVICPYILKDLTSFWSAICHPDKDKILPSVVWERRVTAWKVYLVYLRHAIA